MAIPSQFVPAAFSLAAVLLWGTSDFLGGYAARRVNAFLFTAWVHGSGALFMLMLVWSNHSGASRGSVEWALAAGFFGGVSLAIFYRALAAGTMGILAPVSAVLSAAVPAALAIATQGSPGKAPLAGFVLAGAGLWLVSRPDGNLRPGGLGLAVLAGLGFAGFYLCIKQANGGSAMTVALISRICSFAVTGLVVLVTRNLRRLPAPMLGLAIFTGCIDISGSALFIRATQTGRLDSVVVLSSLYPAVTVLLARLLLKEKLSGWKIAGVFAAILAVPLIALQ